MSSSSSDLTNALRVEGLSIRFGGLAALDQVTFTVAPRAICGVIGPNGAGKSTLLNALTALYPPTSGTIHLGERATTGLGPAAVAALGVGRTFQNLRLFPTQTCLAHVKIGMVARHRYDVFGALFRTRSFRAHEATLDAEARELLAVVDLADFANHDAAALPYGAARRLEIARALATKPSLLLLDEPAAGLTATERQALVTLVRRLRDERGLTIVLIEHDMKLVFELCDQLVVLDHGVVIADGAPADVARSEAVVRAYLGSAAP